MKKPIQIGDQASNPLQAVGGQKFCLFWICCQKDLNLTFVWTLKSSLKAAGGLSKATPNTQLSLAIGSSCLEPSRCTPTTCSAILRSRTSRTMTRRTAPTKTWSIAVPDLRSRPASERSMPESRNRCIRYWNFESYLYNSIVTSCQLQLNSCSY